MIRPSKASREIDPLLGYPHKSYPIVHVTGTNGKGSVSNMIASILIEAGYKVGTFNTPGIVGELDITKVNGVPISALRHYELKRKIKKVEEDNNVKDLLLSTRRAELSFLYFKESNVDIAVIETDLGAENDSTCVVTPIVSLITNITEDHLNLFNHDILEYAKEKAGIIKPNTPVYMAESPINRDIKNILQQKADSCNTKLIFTDQDNLILDCLGDGCYNTKFGKCVLSLKGDYQKSNLNLVLHSIIELRKQGYKISDRDVIEGLNNIYKNTKFCGRWCFIHEKPRVILDCGHNLDAWEKVVDQINSMRYNKLHIVIQICKDKNVDAITKILPDNDKITYWFPTPEFKRLIAPEKLMEKTEWMKKSNRNQGIGLERVIMDLVRGSNEDDVVLICGTCKILNMINNLKL